MKKIEDLNPAQTREALQLMFQKDSALAVKEQTEKRIAEIIGKLNGILADDPKKPEKDGK